MDLNSHTFVLNSCLTVTGEFSVKHLANKTHSKFTRYRIFISDLIIRTAMAVMWLWGESLVFGIEIRCGISHVITKITLN